MLYSKAPSLIFEAGESAEQYITTLYNLIKTCKYKVEIVKKNVKMLRNELVVGIRDAALSQKLQLDQELTLEKAKKAVRQSKAIQDQYRQLKSKNGSKVSHH